MSNTETTRTKSTNIGRHVLAALLSINTGKRRLVAFVVIFVISFLLSASFHAALDFYNRPAVTENVELRLDHCIEGAVGCSYPEAKTSEINGNVELHLGECVEAKAQCSYRGTLKAPEIEGHYFEGFYLLEVDGERLLFDKEYTSVIEHPTPTPDSN